LFPSHDRNSKELFDTDTLPTAYTDEMSADRVVGLVAAIPQSIAQSITQSINRKLLYKKPVKKIKLFVDNTYTLQ